MTKKSFFQFRSCEAQSLWKIYVGLILFMVSSLALAANPSPPGELRFQVYSKTAAEIFWNRATDDGIVREYEIKFNGTTVATRDALSYYSNALVEGRTYDVAVTSIDNEGNRSVPATTSFIGGDRTTPPVSGEVAAPTGLKASVYSSSSGEIMWDRPSTFGLTYEISRNGSVVKTIDGLSYYDNTLTAATTYTYDVVAIDNQGRRSAASTVALSTPGSGGGSTTPPVAAPTGLKASVYSKTSAEIMWDRPSTFGLTYEISRNGSVVKTIDGLSYYDNTLTAATTYTYDVVAIDLQSRRSAPVSVMLNTPSEGGFAGPIVPNDDDPDPGPLPNDNPSIAEPSDLYQRDGYGTTNVIRVDVRTETTPGTCVAGDLSGCTLADVLADVDKQDDLTVDIPIHVKADDFPDDGSVTNAELRLRGSGSRAAPQKSFRIKLDSKEVLWRDERYMQLNKHPYDSQRFRNKLATELMSEIPNLPSLRTQFVNLWIDDGAGPEDYGLFTHVERVNDKYLSKRGWDVSGNIYKVEDFKFDPSDLSDILVDAQGEPLDEERFETSLEIENGEDHRNLQAMLRAINDPDRSFDSVLDQYFNRDNALAWVSANILLHQTDSVRHNYILYNPAGSQKFFFIPWDYDEAMGIWQEPPNDLSNDSLRQRYEYGYGLASGNVFLEKYYRLPGIHNKILQNVDSLRQNHVTDELMTEKVNTFFSLVEPFQTRLPDSENNPWFNVGSAETMISGPRLNAEALRDRFRVLIGAKQLSPENQGATWQFSWIPAYDVTGTSGSISYRLQVAKTPTFESDSIAVDIGSIADAASRVNQSVDAARLSTGTYYARVIATPANEPTRFWQISGNKLSDSTGNYYGVLKFSVP